MDEPTVVRTKPEEVSHFLGVLWCGPSQHTVHFLCVNCHPVPTENMTKVLHLLLKQCKLLGFSPAWRSFSNTRHDLCRSSLKYVLACTMLSSKYTIATDGGTPSWDTLHQLLESGWNIAESMGIECRFLLVLLCQLDLPVPRHQIKGGKPLTFREGLQHLINMGKRIGASNNPHRIWSSHPFSFAKTTGEDMTALSPHAASSLPRLC